ncbi:hypothetical protein HNQ91_004754 [Filimonas zeae]|uniref:Uncharacterized protein n=1 Tax=Filimonas zeae TaxID=1737353 RepID=A0A917J1M9_9BACT|nr:hypothetical protein [Filimonas zeae]MDR6341681.1 hypothetical protein [Filimonas zeae]GGH74677.1 hypothetical protein GCM10011379_37480 [Filimonas zeae]
MKGLNVRSAVAKFSFTALVIAVMAVSAQAAEKNEKKETLVSAKQVSVQYAGYNDNSVVFRVKFDNPTAQKFSLIIKNDAGDVLFQGRYNDSTFNKAIHILKEESEMNPTFIIRVGNQKIEQTFSVTSNTDVVQDVVVTKQ